MGYDYFVDRPTDRTGLVRIASEIKRQRSENPNVLLFDNGDNIQGNPFGDYLSKNPPPLFQPGPIARVMNVLQYDAMGLGNHEFNFGLEYLRQALRGAGFPVICSNVVKPGTDKPYFKPYALLKRRFIDSAGETQELKVGVISLVPPQILAWDGMHLKGKIEVQDGYEAAEKYVEVLRSRGADIVIVLAHSGIADFTRKGGEENFAWYITTIPGVDAVISGHSHMQFPGQGFAKLQGVDIPKGRINGMPVVMPGNFGDNLGVIKLRFERFRDNWLRIDGTGSLVPVYNGAAEQSLPPVQSLIDVLQATHEAVLGYIRGPVGASEEGGKTGGSLTAGLNSFYALVHDDYSVQLINEAQMRYAKKALEHTEYGSLPVLSAAAPFKCGGRQGPNYYTNVPPRASGYKKYGGSVCVFKYRDSPQNEGSRNPGMAGTKRGSIQTDSE